MFGTVLVPIDRNHEALQAFEKALDLSKSDKSQLIVLLVVLSNRTNFKAEDSFLSLLEQVRARTLQGGVECEVIEREGSPAFVICDVADELNVDVIVMGTGGMNHEEGSDNEVSRVIELSPCPVLVVP